jgi:hypothetical protein
LFDNQTPPEQPPRPQEQRPVTAQDIHLQQRAGLALRGLDLEVELILKQEENRRLSDELAQARSRIEELETKAKPAATPAPARTPAPVKAEPT